MNYQELYDYTVRQINDIDLEMKLLQGKREALTDIRLELRSVLEEQTHDAQKKNLTQ